MRVVLPVLLLALAAPSPAAAPASPARPAAPQALGQAPRAFTVQTEKPCPYDVAMRHAREGGAVRPERLGQLPPGDMFHAVARKVDGCLEPVIVRQNIGAGPGR